MVLVGVCWQNKGQRWIFTHMLNLTETLQGWIAHHDCLIMQRMLYLKLSLGGLPEGLQYKQCCLPKKVTVLYNIKTNKSRWFKDASGVIIIIFWMIPCSLMELDHTSPHIHRSHWWPQCCLRKDCTVILISVKEGSSKKRQVFTESLSSLFWVVAKVGAHTLHVDAELILGEVLPKG